MLSLVFFSSCFLSSSQSSWWKNSICDEHGRATFSVKKNSLKSPKLFLEGWKAELLPAGNMSNSLQAPCLLNMSTEIFPSIEATEGLSADQ